MNWLRSQPALAGAIASLIGAIVSVFVKNPALAASLGGVFLAFLGVRQMVTPVTSMVEKTTIAATNAAVETVKALDETTVGVTGDLTETAQAIIHDTVGEAVKGVLGR